jgi:purine-cytosine permease-like protein
MNFFQTPSSNDEYVEQRKTQFKIEGLYIILGVLILNILQGIITGNLADHVLLSFGIVSFFAVYYLLRKVFTGLEYPDIASEKGYKKKRKEVLTLWLTTFVIFVTLNIGQKLLFSPEREWIEIIGLSALFLLFLFLIEYFSVKRSYKKNQDIGSDE